MTTVNPAVATELTRQYETALGQLYGGLTTIEQILAEDFPGFDAAPGAVTRYHVDAVRDLGARVSALIEGYENK
jgi:hypothetical protein